MSDALSAVAELAVVIGGGVYVVWYWITKGRADASRIDAEWENAARILHGNTAGEYGYRRRTLRASLDGKVLLIVAETRSSGQSETHHVKLTSGPLTGLVPLTLHVAKRGILGRVAQRLGVSEVETGDARFHQEVRVTGTPAALAEAFLDRRTREQIRAVAEEIVIEDGEVVIEREEYPETSDALVAMAKYAGVLVERWNLLERAPKELAAALDLALTGNRAPLARGMLRGHEIAMSVRCEETLATVFEVDGQELAFPGIELDADEVAKKLVSHLDALPRRGGYR